MKGMNLFCASPASTTICISRDHKSMVRHSSRAFDRHALHLVGGHMSKPPKSVSSQSPSKPKSCHLPCRKSSAKQTDLSRPLISTTNLLSDNAFFHIFTDFDPLPALVPAHPNESAPVFGRSPMLRDQIVMLRVSLHCKGCEAKVRKHISRMEGVKYFDIDFPTKKVTIIGDVTPLAVLASVSRVKNAQFWPSPRQ